jgi:poly(3-hydroxybutyrate) depolymerase
MVGGKTGAYLLDVPTNYDNNKAYPLVFVWHGSGVKNGMFRDYVGISKAAGNDAIVVTPECLDGVNAWPSDASYFDALLERFSANYCVDTSKVFTAGHSMGGQHTGLLGCLRGDKLRGDAVLAMTHPTGTCVGTKMAAMFVVGDSDFANYATETKYWTDKNKCNMAMTTPVADATQCVEYGGCAPDAQVRTCTFPGGHEIPNWVGAAVWGFFKKL